MLSQDAAKKISIPNPSGEAFVGQFVLFIDTTSPEALSKSSPLKIQPRALEYLSKRLETLRDLQRLKSSDPMAFISGASKDFADYKRLEKIHQFLEPIKHLKLHSAAKGVRDPTPITLSPFRSLVTLELRGCDLSSQCIRGIGHIRPILERLICYDSLEKLHHFFAPVQYETKRHETVQVEWPKLTHLSCPCNSISEIDDSILLLPALQTLDLSRNQLTCASNLANLVFLDLSHNQLTELGEIPDTCPHLEKLFLQGNRLRHIQEIDKLECLEVLDMSCNLIVSMGDVVKASTLPKLRDIELEGNPLAVSSLYRPAVISCFLDRGVDFMLDGAKPSIAEIRKARKIMVSDSGDIVPIAPSETRIVVPPPSLVRNAWQLITKGLAPPTKSRRPSSTSDVTVVDRTTPKKQPKPARRVVNIPDEEGAAATNLKDHEPPLNLSRYTYGQSSALLITNSTERSGLARTHARKASTGWTAASVSPENFSLSSSVSTNIHRASSAPRVSYSVV